MLAKDLKSCSKSNKSPNLVTLSASNVAFTLQAEFELNGRRIFHYNLPIIHLSLSVIRGTVCCSSGGNVNNNDDDDADDDDADDDDADDDDADDDDRLFHVSSSCWPLSIENQPTFCLNHPVSLPPCN